MTEATSPAHTASDARKGAAGKRVALLVWVLMLVSACGHLDRQIISTLAESIKHEFKLQDWQLGLMTGLSYSLFYGLFSLPLAHIADRTNRSFVIAGSLMVGGAFTALAGATSTFIQLIATRLAVGCAEGGTGAASQSLIASSIAKDKRATALGVFAVGAPIGQFVGLLLGGMVIDSYNWRSGMLIAATPSLVLVFLVLLIARGRKVQPLAVPTEPKTSFSLSTFGRDLRDLVRVRSFVLVVLAGGMIAFVNFGQGAFLASFFFRNHGEALQKLATQSLAAVGLSFGAGASLGLALGVAKGAPGIAGGLWGGVITDRLAQRARTWLVALPAISCWVRVPLALGIFLAPSFPIAITLVLVQAFVVGFAGPAGYASIQWVAEPRLRTLGASLYMFSLNLIGFGCGPLVFGFVSDQMQASGMSEGEGLRWALALCSTVGLLIGGGLKWAARKPVMTEAVN